MERENFYIKVDKRFNLLRTARGREKGGVG